MKKLYKILILLIILFTLIVPVFGDEIEWVDPQEKTLRLREFVIRDGFYIEATDFFNYTALISVYDSNNKLIIANITRKNDTMEINERLNITVVDLQERKGNIGATHGLNATVDQWVRIQTRIAGKPIVRVSIGPHEDKIRNKTVAIREFTPGKEIRINFSVRNDGKAVLKDTELNINSTLPLFLADRMNYDLLDIKAGNESEIKTIHFKAPYVAEITNFTINAQARGIDILGRMYEASNSLIVQVKPRTQPGIYIQKFVSEKVYMGDLAVVSILIRNNMSQKIENLTLTEDLSNGLIPVKTNLTWNFSLEPSGEESISYSVKPPKPGSYYFPPGSSLVEYQDGVFYNDKVSKLIVNGPYVLLSKSVNIENPAKGDNVTVTINAHNTGDALAIVKITDPVPGNYTLSTSNMSYSNMSKIEVIHPGKSASFSYILNVKDNGDYLLPPAKAIVLDQFLFEDDRYTQRVISENLSIQAREPIIVQEPVRAISTPIPTIVTQETAVPIPTISPTQSSPGFQGYIFIIIVLIIVYLIKNRKTKNE